MLSPRMSVEWWLMLSPRANARVALAFARDDNEINDNDDNDNDGNQSPNNILTLNNNQLIRRCGK